MKFKIIIVFKDGTTREELCCGLEFEDLHGAQFKFNPNNRGWQNYKPNEIEKIVIQPRNHGENFSI